MARKYTKAEIEAYTKAWSAADTAMQKKKPKRKKATSKKK